MDNSCRHARSPRYRTTYSRFWRWNLPTSARARDVRAVGPADALDLVLEPARIRFSCDPVANPAWKSASQLTVGADELPPESAFRHGRRSVDQYAERLAAMLRR